MYNKKILGTKYRNNIPVRQYNVKYLKHRINTASILQCSHFLYTLNEYPKTSWVRVGRCITTETQLTNVSSSPVTWLEAWLLVLLHKTRIIRVTTSSTMTKQIMMQQYQNVHTVNNRHMKDFAVTNVRVHCPADNCLRSNSNHD